MKKIILFTACALLCAGTALSQNYKHAIGLRAGGSNAALTYKQHLNAGNAFEVMAWFGFYEASSFSAAGLYEWTQPVINNDFNLYYGVGGHLGAAANKFAIGTVFSTWLSASNSPSDIPYRLGQVWAVPPCGGAALFFAAGGCVSQINSEREAIS